MIIGLQSCRGSHDNMNHHGNDIDTLKVVTLYGPTTYFDYRGEKMGIDYENARRFAEDQGMILEISTANNIRGLIDSLKSGKAHLAAYPVPYISEFKEDIIFCGHKDVSKQVLVQKKGKEKLTDVTGLIGKTVAVEENSRFHYRLQNLNEELGGGINILPLRNDTIAVEDFLHMVSEGEVPYTVIDSQTASLYGSAFPDLDFSLGVSADQAASWATAPGLDSLAARIDRWEDRTHSSEFVKSIYKRYYDKALSDPFDLNLSYFKNGGKGKPGTVSAYDAIFKKYAASSGFDWRLIAAISFCESRFLPGVVSPFGATGLMQVMPATAASVGVSPGSLADPDANVKAAVRILKKLDETFQRKIEDPEERMKFVVATYNSGLGHIYDSMALAEKTGLDPGKWTGNVSIATLMKSRPEYYNDPVVKLGYFRGRETVDFVERVSTLYNYLRQNIK